MRSSFMFVAALSLSVVAPLAGCATAPGPQPDSGSLTIPLEQPGSDGALYHLSARFAIDGPGGSQVIDATDFAPSLTLTLPPGITNVELLDGWTLEKSTDFGTTYTPVSAVLGSLNPTSVRILANFSDTLNFQFLVRSTSGQVTIQFGVTLHPRELAGGIIATAGTADYAAYAGARPDYAIYHDLFSVERVELPDGSKDLVLTANSVAVEIFNDGLGLLSNTIAPAFAGGFLQYHFVAHPDGTQEVSGELDSSNSPFSILTFGPHTLQFTFLPLDLFGFPTDVFFNESNVPFNLTTFFDAGDATLTGTLRFRSIPVTN